MNRPRFFTGMALGVAMLSSLAACSSSSAKSTATTATTAPATTEASTTAPATTEPATTLAATTTTTAATTTTKPAPTGPTVSSLSTSNKNPSCADVTTAGYQWKVSWKATNAASVIIGIDSPDPYKNGPATGSEMIPANCGDTQVVYITPVAGDGTKGTPKKITITIGS